jgi:hypothetical protein
MPSPDLTEIPVRTPTQLTRRWADLLEPPVFGARSLWLAWVAADGLMPPVIVPVDDVPPVPDRPMLDGLLHLHAAVVEQRLGAGGHLALALCRPGAPRPTAEDERWADALRAALTARIAESWSLHLAAGGEVTPLVDPPWWRPS